MQMCCIRHIVTENRPVKDLIAPGYAMLNDRLAQHHRRIDPWGFGLENFDPIGQWRTHYRGKKKQNPVDAKGKMPNGDSFEGVTGVQKALLDRERQLTHALAAKLLSHATGQSTSIKGKLALDEIVTANMKGKNGVLDLIEKICVSPIFLE